MNQTVQRKYRVLYIGYWNANDGLTSSTILPHLAILRSMPQIERLYFTNIERESVPLDRLRELESVTDGYFPLASKSTGINLLTKLMDFRRFPEEVLNLCKKFQIDIILARGAPAGALAWIVWRKLRIPYIVESFEPHADYMAYSDTWARYDPRYIFQKYWEGKQKKTARKLVVVSRHYLTRLILEGVPSERIDVVPCCVNPNTFYSDERLRAIHRQKLEIPAQSYVGVYAGKFGGLYLDDKAFEIFKRCFLTISNFYLLLISTHDKNWINDQLNKFDIPPDRVKLVAVPFHEMNGYLNIADFAFAMYKSNHVSPFLSPVKLGEYWAVGLPVIVTGNIGDESDLIEQSGLGVIYKEEMDIEAFMGKCSRNQIRKKALEIRSFDKVKRCYNMIFN